MEGSCQTGIRSASPFSALQSAALNPARVVGLLQDGIASGRDPLCAPQRADRGPRRQ